MISTSLLKRLSGLPFLDVTLESGINISKDDVLQTLNLLLAQKGGKQIQRKVRGDWTDCRINPNDAPMAFCFRVKP